MRYFLDRSDAGKQLATALASWRGQTDALVLALPRGGVPVAFEIADALELPLDILLVRKLGVPSQPELAMGALAEGNIMVINADIVRQLHLSKDTIDAVAAREVIELRRRMRQYRGTDGPPELRGRRVLLVDDGCATGANMRAAIEACRHAGAKTVVAVTPVASWQAKKLLEEKADAAVVLSAPEPFMGVGHYYINFLQVGDDEVRDLLDRSRHPQFAKVS